MFMLQHSWLHVVLAVVPRQQMREPWSWRFLGSLKNWYVPCEGCRGSESMITSNHHNVRSHATLGFSALIQNESVLAKKLSSRSQAITVLRPHRNADSLMLSCWCSRLVRRPLVVHEQCTETEWDPQNWYAQSHVLPNLWFQFYMYLCKHASKAYFSNLTAKIWKSDDG